MFSSCPQYTRRRGGITCRTGDIHPVTTFLGIPVHLLSYAFIQSTNHVAHSDAGQDLHLTPSIRIREMWSRWLTVACLLVPFGLVWETDDLVRFSRTTFYTTVYSITGSQISSLYNCGELKRISESTIVEPWGLEAEDCIRFWSCRWIQEGTMGTTSLKWDNKFGKMLPDECWLLLQNAWSEFGIHSLNTWTWTGALAGLLIID